MKKLQGAHLRKVGHEGRGAPEGGVQKPAPFEPPGRVGEDTYTWLRACLGRPAELIAGRGGVTVCPGVGVAFPHLGVRMQCDGGKGEGGGERLRFIGPSSANRCLQPQEAGGRGAGA